MGRSRVCLSVLRYPSLSLFLFVSFSPLSIARCYQHTIPDRYDGHWNGLSFNSNLLSFSVHKIYNLRPYSFDIIAPYLQPNV
jgi:hypothetical protein